MIFTETSVLAHLGCGAIYRILAPPYSTSWELRGAGGFFFSSSWRPSLPPPLRIHRLTCLILSLKCQPLIRLIFYPLGALLSLALLPFPGVFCIWGLSVRLTRPGTASAAGTPGLASPPATAHFTPLFLKYWERNPSGTRNSELGGVRSSSASITDFKGFFFFLIPNLSLDSHLIHNTENQNWTQEGIEAM